MSNERTLPGAGFTAFADKGTDDWHLFHDLNMLKLAILDGGFVKSKVTSLPGSPVDGDTYIVPTGDANAEDIAVWCRADYGASGTLQWNYFTPRKGWSFYVEDESLNYQWDGSGWVAFAGGSSAYDVRGGFGATPSVDDILDTILVVRDIQFPVDFTGSAGLIDASSQPTASFVVSVQDNGVEFGTITISTGGAFTFATTGGIPYTINSGQALTFVAPNPVDATAANATWTLKGAV